MRNKLIILHIIFYYFFAFSFSFHYDFLPQNIEEAELMLKTGELDSLDWDILRQYYINPIIVPLGELVYLTELFDIQLDNLPYTYEQLKQYEPWGKEEIEKFFIDYPYLEKYKPILKFSKIKNFSSKAGLILYCDDSLKTSAISRFSFNFPQKYGFLNGSVSIKDSFILWNSRSISGIIPKIVSFKVGNFSLTKDIELFLGYFGKDNKQTTTLSNWLYGKTRTWNGIYLQTDIWKHSNISAFFHERITERVFGLFYEYLLNKKLKLKAGLTDLVIPDSNNNFKKEECFFNYSIYIQDKFYDFSFFSGFESKNPLLMPFYLEFFIKNNNSTQKIFALNIPNGCFIERSRLFYDCYTELEDNDSAFEQINLIGLNSTLLLSNNFNTKTQITYITNRLNSSVNASALIRGRSFINYEAGFGYRMVTATLKERHNIFIELQRDIVKYLSFTNRTKVYSYSSGYTSLFNRSVWDIILNDNYVKISPYIEIFVNNKNEYNTFYGLRYTHNILKRNILNCDFSFSPYNKRWLFDAGANFCF